MSQELTTSLSAALTELEQIRVTAASVVEQLKHGIGLEPAYLIIDRYWEGNEASNLKTKLSGNFPRENGEAILSATFSERLGVALEMTHTKAYFNRAFPEIISQVERVYDIINAHDLNDQEALMKLNDFRKEPARFIDFISSGWFDGRDKVVKGEISNWDGLRQETDSIESGDYLFLNDYRQDIRCAQEKMEENLFGYNDPSTYALGGLDDCMCRLIGMVKVTAYFVQFLEGHAAGHPV